MRALFVLYQLYTEGHPVGHDDSAKVDEFLAQVNVAPELIERFDPTYPLGADIKQDRELAPRRRSRTSNVCATRPRWNAW